MNDDKFKLDIKPVEAGPSTSVSGRKKKRKTVHSSRYLLIRGLLVVVVVLVVVALGYLLIPKLINIITKDNSTEKVLTIADLGKPDVQITPDTSDASVDNLDKGLQAEIDKQIAAKENPFETTYQLAGVLSNTTNKSRPYQMADFVIDFLTNHENELWYATELGLPDQAQVNYWKGELYERLVYNYQFIMQNKFTGSDGKPIDTTKEQLKYIDLYLALANDPKSHIAISEEKRAFLTDYQYNEVNNFLELKSRLNA
jgi:hypothetical protein